MGKVSFCLFLLLGVMSATGLAQKRNDAQWIAHLKATPVDELGSGLPHETFAVWFAGLVGPNRTEYRVEGCDLANPSENTTEHVLCVMAYTKPPHHGDQPWIHIAFIVGETV